MTGELSVPSNAPRGLRFDTGVAAGSSKSSLYYDSLLAKLIAHGADRRRRWRASA